MRSQLHRPDVILELYVVLIARPIRRHSRSFAHLDMYHFVFGINFQIHFVNFTSLVSIHSQNLPFQQILPTLDFFYLLDCLMIMTYHAHHFIFSFTFYFFVYSVWYPLATRQLFTAR